MNQRKEPEPRLRLFTSGSLRLGKYSPFFTTPIKCKYILTSRASFDTRLWGFHCSSTTALQCTRFNRITSLIYDLGGTKQKKATHHVHVSVEPGPLVTWGVLVVEAQPGNMRWMWAGCGRCVPVDGGSSSQCDGGRRRLLCDIWKSSPVPLCLYIWLLSVMSPSSTSPSSTSLAQVLLWSALWLHKYPSNITSNTPPG